MFDENIECYEKELHWHFLYKIGTIDEKLRRKDEINLKPLKDRPYDVVLLLKPQ